MANAQARIAVGDGPIRFLLNEPRRFQRVLPYLTAGLLWAAQQVVSDADIQRQVRARENGLRVDLEARPSHLVGPKVYKVVRRRSGVVEIFVTVDVGSVDRPEDHFLGGVAIVANAYAEGVRVRKIPTSAAVEDLLERATEAGISVELPDRREWVGRKVIFRYPATHGSDWIRTFKERIDTVSNGVEIQFHYSGLDSRDAEVNVSDFQLFTAGQASAVAALIHRIAAASGAPPGYDIVEYEPFPIAERGGAVEDPSALFDAAPRSELVVEIHVPLDSGSEWIETVENFLASVNGGDLDYDDGEEWQDQEGGPEYLFFLYNSDEPTLLRVAGEVAALPGVPRGVYAVINTAGGDMGDGRRVPLRVEDASD